MMSSLSAIQSLAELQSKFRPDTMMSFDTDSSLPIHIRDHSDKSVNTRDDIVTTFAFLSKSTIFFCFQNNKERSNLHFRIFFFAVIFQ
ncbi:hypothetical protein DICVIV_02873 [Dictyocaulus viviparus]|uniref:Uncharacterized protein n=1 Tax=Dictyocaulus viviparus TaxID=29172 RepID=A0A0D8Y2T0_DICVI|nr:hypothetical protein DICVIV_02873 [Dictyocaulus viviparus]